MRPTPKENINSKNPDSYEQKFEQIRQKTEFNSLPPEISAYIKEQAFALRFSQQELKGLCETAMELESWQEQTVKEFWSTARKNSTLSGRQLKKELFSKLETFCSKLKAKEKQYPPEGLCAPGQVPLKKIYSSSKGPISGLCPVASDKTICCRLRTIDAVTNCGFGCSYCIIQSFYSGNRVIFESNLKEKLKQINLNPKQLYHFGSGQSSDSLMWGNEEGLLENLLDFARNNPNIVLELKTKSANINELLELDIPKNVVCSWTLNSPTIIKNEEHFTASLEERLSAARTVADRGIFTAFHFHPVFLYSGWEEEYRQTAQKVLGRFNPEEVLFLSFGSVTFIKPVVKKIRSRREQTKVLQMDFSPDPHGKLTYSDEIKTKLFKNMYEAFSPWHKDVLIYLCMEKKDIWEKSFGFSHENSEIFEKYFMRRCYEKIDPALITDDYK